MAEAPRYIRIGRTDNVAVALTDLAAGERCEADGLAVTLAQPVGRGHKFALTAIPAQSAVIKYDMPIGNATREIRPGEFVHTHNLKTRLSGDSNTATLRRLRRSSTRARRAGPFRASGAPTAPSASAMISGSCRPSAA